MSAIILTTYATYDSATVSSAALCQNAPVLFLPGRAYLYGLQNTICPARIIGGNAAYVQVLDKTSLDAVHGGRVLKESVLLYVMPFIVVSILT